MSPLVWLFVFWLGGFVGGLWWARDARPVWGIVLIAAMWPVFAISFAWAVIEGRRWP